MKKPILIALLCAGLMLVTPLVGVAQENKISDNIKEQQVDFEGLVVQIRNVVNKILLKYGHIPIIANQCGKILNLLDSGGNIVICIFLYILVIPLLILHTVLVFMRLEYLRQYVAMFTGVIGFLMSTYCPPYNSFISKLPFQSIYSMLNVNDNKQSFEGCPCLEE